jgi:hypothetical protein
VELKQHTYYLEFKIMKKETKKKCFVFLVYADASDTCNQLNFQLGPTAIGTSIPTRQWNIKVKVRLV